MEFSINQKDKNKQYIKRIGAYAIIKNNENLIAIVKTNTGHFLPGGGIKNGESLLTCLKRECIEEIGAEITILNKFARGNFYFYSTIFKINIESSGHFFICKIDKYLDVIKEVDHELIWLDKKKAIQLLYLENQKEAIRIFKNKEYD